MFGKDHFLALVLINTLGFAGILIWHIQGRSRPTGRLIVQILFFATMSLVPGLGGISPYRLDQTELQGAGLLIAKSLSLNAKRHFKTPLALRQALMGRFSAGTSPVPRECESSGKPLMVRSRDRSVRNVSRSGHASGGCVYAAQFRQTEGS